MKKVGFVSHYPFEIGDIVRVKGVHEAIIKLEFEIVDLLAIHSCKNGTVTFKAILNKLDGTLRDLELDVEHLIMVRYGSSK